MGYSPIFANLAGRPCLVIGGGTVAERKVEGLLATKAAVMVLSPSVTARLEVWKREGQIHHVARVYHPGDLIGYQLVFVATGDPEVNSTVYQEGQRRGIWVNAVDDPDHGNVILPSALHRGPLTVAVSTGGTCPTLAKLIREELEMYFTKSYTLPSEVAAEAHRTLRQEQRTAAGERWQKVLEDQTFRRLIRDGHQAAATTYLLVEQLENDE